MQIETKNYHFLQRPLIYLIVIIIIAVIFWSSVEFQKIFTNSILFTAQYLERYYFLGIFVFLMLSVISAILSPFSSVPLIPIVITVWGNVLTMFILMLGWVLGSIVSYFLGSFTGYSLLKKIFSTKKVEQYKQLLFPRINFLTVILFRVAVPTEIAGYLLGTIKYNFLKYIFATTIVEALFAVIVVYSGEAFMNANKGRFIFFIFLIIFLTSISLYFFEKNKMKKYH